MILEDDFPSRAMTPRGISEKDAYICRRVMNSPWNYYKENNKLGCSRRKIRRLNHFIYILTLFPSFVQNPPSNSCHSSSRGRDEGVVSRSEISPRRGTRSPRSAEKISISAPAGGVESASPPPSSMTERAHGEAAKGNSSVTIDFKRKLPFTMPPQHIPPLLESVYTDFFTQLEAETSEQDESRWKQRPSSCIQPSEH